MQIRILLCNLGLLVVLSYFLEARTTFIANLLDLNTEHVAWGSLFTKYNKEKSDNFVHEKWEFLGGNVEF